MSDELKPTHWYWVRREDGTIAPYRFHQRKTDSRGRLLGEFFVGSFVRTFPLSAVIGEAEMPSSPQTVARAPETANPDKNATRKRSGRENSGDERR